MRGKTMRKEIIIILMLISVFVIAGCNKIDEIKQQYEGLVCSQETDKTGSADSAGESGDAAGDKEYSLLTGRVVSEASSVEDNTAGEDNIDDAASSEIAEKSGLKDDGAAASDAAAQAAEAAADGAQQKTAIEKVYTEGDFIKLRPKAVDRDNDEVTFTFSEPVSQNGEWQTKEGDAGTYYVTITASDGKSTVSKIVKLIINAKNKAPVIEIADTINIREGEMLTLKPQVTDPDGDNVEVTYSGWFSSGTYTAEYGDAGSHTIVITASDGLHTTTKEVAIVVEDVNRKPVVEDIKDVVAVEGETIRISPVAHDDDNDEVIFAYMPPLDEEGVWHTAKGDAGTYNAVLTASDRKSTAMKTFRIIVNPANKPPIITPIQKMLVQVGDTVVLNPEVFDEDGDEVAVSYSGWMTSATKVAAQDDAGVHTVTITASDGKDETGIEVAIEVNSPPEFVV